jgi:hypothetical protein
MALTRSDFEVIRVVKVFPAPLCEACSDPWDFVSNTHPQSTRSWRSSASISVPYAAGNSRCGVRKQFCDL